MRAGPPPDRAAQAARTRAPRRLGAVRPPGATITRDDPGRRPAARDARPPRRAQWLAGGPRVRRAHQGLGGPPQRARRRHLPVRHPGGPRAPRAGLGGRARPGRRGRAAAGSRPAASASRTLSPPGRSARRTSTACCPRSCSCFRQRDAQAGRPGRLPGRVGPACLHRRGPAGDPGPLARGHLVGAGRRAQAVARRRGHRAGRRRSSAPFGPPVKEGPTIGLAATGGPAKPPAGGAGPAGGPCPARAAAEETCRVPDRRSGTRQAARGASRSGCAATAP